MKYVFVSVAMLLAICLNGSAIAQAPNGTPDPLFKEHFIDIDEWRDKPVRHRYVHGGFKGTNTRFSFYFPPKDQYQGRFFQYITPFPDNENLSQGASGEEDKIGFAISSGAYFIETNGGGRVDFGRRGAGAPRFDRVGRKRHRSARDYELHN